MNVLEYEWNLNIFAYFLYLFGVKMNFWMALGNDNCTIGKVREEQKKKISTVK